MSMTTSAPPTPPAIAPTFDFPEEPEEPEGPGEPEDPESEAGGLGMGPVGTNACCHALAVRL